MEKCGHFLMNFWKQLSKILKWSRPIKNLWSKSTRKNSFVIVYITFFHLRGVSTYDVEIYLGYFQVLSSHDHAYFSIWTTKMIITLFMGKNLWRHNITIKQALKSHFLYILMKFKWKILWIFHCFSSAFKNLIIFIINFSEENQIAQFLPNIPRIFHKHK